MNTKIYLTSFIALSFALPAMAAPSHTGEFPSGGLMLEDYTYTNAATSTNMDGVYEGTVNANAQYTDIDYSVAAGLYLTGLDANNDATTATCTPGNFCPGVQSTTYANNAFGNTGLQTCPSGYASSAAGASSDTQCYRACNISNMGENGSIANIAHATAISGNDYFGSGTDTCVPTACENGWHVKTGVNAPNLTSLIGNTEATLILRADYGYWSHHSYADPGNWNDKYGVPDTGMFVADFGSKGIIKGRGRCSTRAWVGSYPWGQETDEETYETYITYSVNPGNFVFDLEDEKGQTGAEYCYCKLDSYIVGGQTQVLYAPWVYGPDTDGVEHCVNNCANFCAFLFESDNLSFRNAIFNSVQASPTMCEANTITINWGDTDSADVTANEAGTCTYGGNINTPVKAQHKNGKRFVGWTFSKPSGN